VSWNCYPKYEACLLILPTASHTNGAPGTVDSVASSNKSIEPRITYRPTINTLKDHDNSEGKSFIGYYYLMAAVVAHHTLNSS
jgi:hypothetical protein